MNIWIDLTDLKAWKGPFTGIQRVVYNLAARYESVPGVRFFEFLDLRGVFTELSFNVVRHEGVHPGGPAGEDQEARGRFKETAREPFRRMRRYLRPFLPDFFVRSVRNVLKYCLRLAPGPREIRPDRGDLLLVLGAAWTKPDLLCKLTRLKQARGCGMISLVYDLLPLYHPHLFGTGGPAFRERFRKYITALVSGSDGIAAISEATSRDIERFCRESGIACSPVHVFRLGDDYDERIPGPPPGGLKPGGYILIVGTIEMRKNPLLVYQMVKQASMEGICLPPVVLVGRPGSEFEIIRRLTQEDPEVRGRIRLLASMDDAGLNRLYRNCLFTIYPSMCEGWGLPIAESLCHGKICIASRTSSMPEIAGDLIEYASPYDPGEFLDLVRKYLVPTVREKKEKEIAARYRPHGWDEAFSRFDAIVRMVIKADGGER